MRTRNSAAPGSGREGRAQSGRPYAKPGIGRPKRSPPTGRGSDVPRERSPMCSCDRYRHAPSPYPPAAAARHHAQLATDSRSCDPISTCWHSPVPTPSRIRRPLGVGRPPARRSPDSSVRPPSANARSRAARFTARPYQSLSRASASPVGTPARTRNRQAFRIGILRGSPGATVGTTTASGRGLPPRQNGCAGFRRRRGPSTSPTVWRSIDAARRVCQAVAHPRHACAGEGDLHGEGRRNQGEHDMADTAAFEKAVHAAINCGTHARSTR
jgi:hypothetical protein